MALDREHGFGRQGVFRGPGPEGGTAAQGAWAHAAAVGRAARGGSTDVGPLRGRTAARAGIDAAAARADSGRTGGCADRSAGPGSACPARPVTEVAAADGSHRAVAEGQA